jgi:hypothetical protein
MPALMQKRAPSGSGCEGALRSNLVVIDPPCLTFYPSIVEAQKAECPGHSARSDRQSFDQHTLGADAGALDVEQHQADRQSPPACACHYCLPKSPAIWKNPVADYPQLGLRFDHRQRSRPGHPAAADRSLRRPRRRWRAPYPPSRSAHFRVACRGLERVRQRHASDHQRRSRTCPIGKADAAMIVADHILEPSASRHDTDACRQ